MRRALVALLLAWVVAALVLFVWVPFADDDPRTDAIIVLAGSRTRLPVALDLLAHGRARTLAVSRDPRDRARVRLCRSPPADVVCFSAQPYSTRGEARAAAALARARGWRSLAVVTSRFHLFRARLIFRRAPTRGSSSCRRRSRGGAGRSRP